MTRPILRNKYRGFSVVGWLLMIPVALIALLILAVAFFEGRKAYWDYTIRQMCEKDGGVTIYERIRISKADINRHVLPMTADGKLGIALKTLARTDAPAYAERKTTYLREWNPQVGRVEWTAIRSGDQAVVARWISYGRFGGDFPSPAHESHFSCPDPIKITSDLHQLFIVEGDIK